MANILINRFLNNKLLLKVAEWPHSSPFYTCTSLLLQKLDENWKLRPKATFLNQPNPLLSFHHLKSRQDFKLDATTNFIRNYSGKDDENEKNEKKLSMFQKFKKMYKEYWYVLVPVHVVTSTMWLGGFYYMAKSGVDIISILESMHVSETIIRPFRDSSMGYIAVTYALYKIATPARYTVTLGGTTISINYLKKWGYIKPAGEIKEIYKEKIKDAMSDIQDFRNVKSKSTKENRKDDK